MPRGKTAVNVNKILLQKAVEAAEKDGPKESLKDLWEIVAQLYNKTSPLSPIHPQLAARKVSEFEISYITKSGRISSKLVDHETLKKAIQEVEKDGPLVNRNELWPKVVEAYIAFSPDGAISVSNARVKADEWNIEIKTPLKKRAPMSAEHKAALLAARASAGPRAPRKAGGEKLRSHPKFKEHFKILRKNTPQKYHSIVDRAERGSRKAADVLQCLQCVGYVPREVRDCTDCGGCPLWINRPYQRKANDNRSDEEILEDLPVIEDEDEKSSEVA